MGSNRLFYKAPAGPSRVAPEVPAEPFAPS